MPGLFLNSYPLKLSGEAELYEIEKASRAHSRRELQRKTGVPLWMGRTDAFAYDKPMDELLQVNLIRKKLAPPDPLSLWAIRESIVAHCRSLGYEAWHGGWGEIHVLGPIPASTEDRFRIEHGMVIRVSNEEYVSADAVLTARHRAHWLSIGALDQPDVARWAVGRRAVRLQGDGPRSGRIVDVTNSQVTLKTAGTSQALAAADYAMTVNAPVIAQWRGSDVLRRIRVMTGDITVNGKKNRHAVKDRFKLVGDSVRKLGEKVSVKGGGEVEIGRLPVSIRLEEKA